MNVVVVEILVYPERIQFPGPRRHLIGLLVIAPIADVANALDREEIGCVRRLLEVRTGPADGALARRILDSGDRGPDVLAFILLRHANVDNLAAGKAMRDELGVALLALFDQERVAI